MENFDEYLRQLLKDLPENEEPKNLKNVTPSQRQPSSNTALPRRFVVHKKANPAAQSAAVQRETPALGNPTVQSIYTQGPGPQGAPMPAGPAETPAVPGRPAIKKLTAEKAAAVASPVEKPVLHPIIKQKPLGGAAPAVPVHAEQNAPTPPKQLLRPVAKKSSAQEAAAYTVPQTAAPAHIGPAASPAIAKVAPIKRRMPKAANRLENVDLLPDENADDLTAVKLSGHLIAPHPAAAPIEPLAPKQTINPLPSVRKAALATVDKEIAPATLPVEIIHETPVLHRPEEIDLDALALAAKENAQQRPEPLKPLIKKVVKAGAAPQHMPVAVNPAPGERLTDRETDAQKETAALTGKTLPDTAGAKQTAGKFAQVQKQPLEKKPAAQGANENSGEEPAAQSAQKQEPVAKTPKKKKKKKGLVSYLSTGAIVLGIALIGYAGFNHELLQYYRMIQGFFMGASSNSGSMVEAPQTEGEEIIQYPVGVLVQDEARQGYVSGEMLLVIPRIDIAYYIQDGIGEEMLRLGPGLYEYSPLPGYGNPNVAIAAHRGVYGAEFYNLDKLQPEDLVFLYFRGKIYTYRFMELTMVDQDDWDLLRCTEESLLSLTSCDFNSTRKRWVATCMLVAIQDGEVPEEFSSLPKN